MTNDSSEDFQIHLANASETLALGEQLGRSLPPNSVILLLGELGAGKTTLVQGLAQGLGIRDPILSPTFTLISEYTEGRWPLYHLDLYRLQGADVEALAPEMYWEGIEVAPGITAVEWAQRLPYSPPAYLQVQLEYTPQGERQVTLKQVGMEPLNSEIILDR